MLCAHHRLALAGLFAVIAFLSDGAVADTSTPALSYWLVEEWTIPAGGFVRTAVVTKANPTESELRSVGEMLRKDTKGDKNAFIYVYDDARAALNRRRTLSETLTQREMQHHNRHRVGIYIRNRKTRADEFQITPSGLDGPEIVVRYG